MATTTEIKEDRPFWSHTFNEREPVAIQAIWKSTEESPNSKEVHGYCSKHMRGADVVICGPSVPIQTIVHEVRHALDWLGAMDLLESFEEAARLHGHFVEEIMGALIRAGWSYGAKLSPGALFNTDIPVALNRPKEPVEDAFKTWNDWKGSQQLAAAADMWHYADDVKRQAWDAAVAHTGAEIERLRAYTQYLERHLATTRQEVKLVELKGDDLLRQLLSYRRQLVEFDASEMARARGGTAEDYYQEAHNHVNQIYGTKWKLRQFVDASEGVRTPPNNPNEIIVGISTSTHTDGEDAMN